VGWQLSHKCSLLGSVPLKASKGLSAQRVWHGDHNDPRLIRDRVKCVRRSRAIHYKINDDVCGFHPVLYATLHLKSTGAGLLRTETTSNRSPRPYPSYGAGGQLPPQRKYYLFIAASYWAIMDCFSWGFARPTSARYSQVWYHRSLF